MKYSTWNRHGRPLSLPTWKLALILVLALALGIAFAIVATGVFLVALPIAALVVLGVRLFDGRRRSRDRQHVIEGEYEVLDGARTARWRTNERR